MNIHTDNLIYLRSIIYSLTLTFPYTGKVVGIDAVYVALPPAVADKRVVWRGVKYHHHRMHAACPSGFIESSVRRGTSWVGKTCHGVYGGPDTCK